MQKIRINALDSLVYKNDYWILGEKSSLYKLSKGVLKEIMLLEDDSEEKLLYTSILQWNDNLVFVSGVFSKVIIWNIKSEEKKEIQLIIPNEKICSSTHLFFSGLIKEDILYLFGYAFPGIYAINLSDETYRIIDDFIEEASKHFNCNSEGLFHMSSVIVDNKAFIPFMNGNIVLSLDLKTEITKLFVVGDASQRYIAIEWDGEKFWLVPRDGKEGKIVSWDYKTGKTNIIENWPDAYIPEKYGFYRTAMLDDELLIFAHIGNINIKINTKTNKIEPFDHLYDIDKTIGCKYPVVRKDGSNILVFDGNNHSLYKLSKKSVSFEEYELDDDIKHKYYKKFFQAIRKDDKGNYPLIHEKESFGLKEFIWAIK